MIVSERPTGRFTCLAPVARHPHNGPGLVVVRVVIGNPHTGTSHSCPDCVCRVPRHRLLAPPVSLTSRGGRGACVPVSRMDAPRLQMTSTPHTSACPPPLCATYRKHRA